MCKLLIIPQEICDILDNSNDHIIVVDEKEDVIYMNRRSKLYYGSPRSKRMLQGRSLSQVLTFLYPVYGKEFYSLIKSSNLSDTPIAHSASRTIIKRVPYRDGGFIYYFQLDNFWLVDTLAETRDKTLISILDNIPVPLIIHSFYDELIFVNKAICSILPEKEYSSTTELIEALIIKEDIPKCLGVYSAIAEKAKLGEKSVSSVTVRGKHKDGGEVYLLLNISASIDMDGKLELLTMFVDKTEDYKLLNKLTSEITAATLVNGLLTQSMESDNETIKKELEELKSGREQ